MMEPFLEFVAGIFGVEAAELSLSTAYGEYPKWDSLMMINLTMEIEEEYHVSIPIENVSKVKTLADLYEYVK